MPDLRTFVYKIPTLVVGIVCLLAAIPAFAQTPKTETRYADPEFGYSFAVPKDWTHKTDLPRPMVAFLAPEEQGYSANFSVNVFDRKVKPTEEKAFLQNIVTEYKKQKMALSAQTKTTLAGTEAWQWSAKISAPNFPKVENRQVVAFREGRAYILTFTYLPALRAKYAPVCDRLLLSFRFGKPIAKDTGNRKQETGNRTMQKGRGEEKP